MVRNLETAEGMLTSRDMLPRNRYVVRCTNEEFGPSKSSGNPMITRTWEIVHPEKVSVNGVDKIVAGLEVTQYLPTIVLQDDKKTRDDTKSDKALSRIKSENEALGITDPEAVGAKFDDENPKLVANGIVADAILSCEASKQFASPTPEEVANGKKFGQPIKDDNGKDIVVYRIRLDSILGKSSMEVNRPY